MGSNKRRMESERAAAAAKEAEARRALGLQILADAEHLVATWNARRCHRRAPLVPVARCAACGTVNAIDLCARSIVTRTCNHQPSKGFGTKTKEWEMGTVAMLTKESDDDGSLMLNFPKAHKPLACSSRN